MILVNRSADIYHLLLNDLGRWRTIIESNERYQANPFTLGR